MADEPVSLVDEAVFRPVRSGNSLEDTVARLMQTIRLGVVSPGDALPSERDLAARFSVSRDTVREAIRELSEAGYLTSKRGRYGGTFVTDPLPPPPVVPAVAPTASEIEDVVGLREILEVGSVRAAATRSLGAENRSRVNELLDTFPLLARTIEHSNRQHEAIVFAILAGNEQGAAEAMREHLEASAVLLRGFLA
jgi:GntR family transcriptional repressor for pyruvate dehydrogenase complex